MALRQSGTKTEMRAHHSGLLLALCGLACARPSGLSFITQMADTLADVSPVPLSPTVFDSRASFRPVSAIRSDSDVIILFQVSLSLALFSATTGR